MAFDRWATDSYPAGASPWAGTPSRVEPPDGVKDVGITPGDVFPAQYINWLLGETADYVSGGLQTAYDRSREIVGVDAYTENPHINISPPEDSADVGNIVVVGQKILPSGSYVGQMQTGRQFIETDGWLNNSSIYALSSGSFVDYDGYLFPSGNFVGRHATNVASVSGSSSPYNYMSTTTYVTSGSSFAVSRSAEVRLSDYLGVGIESYASGSSYSATGVRLHDTNKDKTSEMRLSQGDFTVSSSQGADFTTPLFSVDSESFLVVNDTSPTLGFISLTSKYNNAVTSSMYLDWNGATVRTNEKLVLSAANGISATGSLGVTGSIIQTHTENGVKTRFVSGLSGSETIPHVLLEATTTGTAGLNGYVDVYQRELYLGGEDIYIGLNGSTTTIGGSILFGSNVPVNALESGNWAPTLSNFAGTGPAIGNFAFVAGHYTKIGNIVTVSSKHIVTTLGWSGSCAFEMSLPYAAASNFAGSATSIDANSFTRMNVVGNNALTPPHSRIKVHLTPDTTGSGVQIIVNATYSVV